MVVTLMVTCWQHRGPRLRCLAAGLMLLLMAPLFPYYSAVCPVIITPPPTPPAIARFYLRGSKLFCIRLITPSQREPWPVILPRGLNDRFSSQGVDFCSGRLRLFLSVFKIFAASSTREKILKVIS